MSQIKIERWQCDRCGALSKDRPWVRFGRWHVAARSDFGEEKVYTTFDWHDLCQPCNSVVEQEVEAMKASAAEARSASIDKRRIEVS